MAKPMHIGHAARSGVLAARLAQVGFTANERNVFEHEQGFLDVVRAIEQRPDARFCAHGVGYMWDGAVARFANSQRFFAPGCICVSRSWGFRGDLAC